MQRQFRHSGILNCETQPRKSSDVLPLGLRHENVFQPGNLSLVLIGQPLSTFTTVEQVSEKQEQGYLGYNFMFPKSIPILVSKHINTGRRPRRAIGEDLKADCAWHITRASLFDLLSLLLGIGNVFLEPLVLQSSCIVHWQVHQKAIQLVFRWSRSTTVCSFH